MQIGKGECPLLFFASSLSSSRVRASRSRKTDTLPLLPPPPADQHQRLCLALVCGATL